jgi:hypothetical protein
MTPRYVIQKRRYQMKRPFCCAILIVVALSANSQAVISWGALQTRASSFEDQTVTIKGVSLYMGNGLERYGSGEDSPFLASCEKGGQQAVFHTPGQVLVTPEMAAKIIDYFSSLSEESATVDITGVVKKVKDLLHGSLASLLVTKIVFADGTKFQAEWMQ